MCVYTCARIGGTGHKQQCTMLTPAAFLLHRERVKLVTNQATKQAYALCVTQDEEKAGMRTQYHTTTHHDSDHSNWFVSMLHVLHAHALLERIRLPLKHTTISVLAVLCTLSDNTYVHVHVCGSARSGGGPHMKWKCHIEAHDNCK